MIETKRLILRPVQESDVDALVSELNNFNIVRNTARIPFPYHRDDAIDYLNYISTHNARSLALAISLSTAPTTLIGGISYLYSAEKNDAELGYWLSEAHWGKSMMTEAANAMVHHAFAVTKLEKLVACYHNDNLASAKILQKLGFKGNVQCSHFSLAQGKEVQVTNLMLTRETWLAKNTK